MSQPISMIIQVDSSIMIEFWRTPQPHAGASALALAGPHWQYRPSRRIQLEAEGGAVTGTVGCQPTTGETPPKDGGVIFLLGSRMPSRFYGQT